MTASARAWLAAIVVAALAGLLLFTHLKAYDVGQQAGASASALELKRAEAASERRRAELLERIVAASNRIHDLELEASARDRVNAEKAKQRVAAVEKATHANPDFSAARRPADLDRLRDDQLADIAAAAARAPIVPRAGLQGVPAASDPVRPDAR